MLSGIAGLFRQPAGGSRTSRSNILPSDVSAAMLGPKHYTIKNPNPALSLAALGCYGENSIEQKIVAKLLNDIHGFDYLFGVGDNFYKFGLGSVLDPRIKLEFDDIYFSKDLPFLNNKMFIQIPGNHDESLCNLDKYIEGPLSYTGKYKETARGYLPAKWRPSGEHGEARAIHEVNLTFERIPKDKFIDGVLDPAEHKGWIMPHFYNTYSDGPIHILAIDSNTILEYYLGYLETLVNGEPIDPLNQFVFMKQFYDRINKATESVILAQHHPLFSSSKERKETTIYLSPLQAKQLDLILQLRLTDDDFVPTVRRILSAKTEEELAQRDSAPFLSGDADNYERLLRDFYAQQQMTFDLIMCAHDHNLSYYNNHAHAHTDYQIRQITTGGGGAPPNDLMRRKNYMHQDEMGCFLKKNGFTQISCDKTNPKLIFIDIYTTDGLHLRFNNQTHIPLREPSNDLAVEKLRDVILSACDSYLKQPQKTETRGLITNSYTHTDDQDDCAHYLWAYLNQPIPLTIDSIKIKLKEYIDSLADASKTTKTSFYRILNRKLLENHQPDLDRLFLHSEKLDSEWGTMSSRF